MRLYNRELEGITNPDREKRVQMLAERNILFVIEKYGIDESMLRKKLDVLSVVEREEKSFFVIYNGKKEEIPNRGSAAAFAGHMSQEYDGNKWSFENAIYISDNNKNHKITHELFHYFSDITEMSFEANGIGYDKSGISITGYDKEDKEVNVGLKASGLNEGITEMLAMQVDGMEEPDAYDKQTYLASILVNGQDNALVNAYFSSDATKFQEFLEDFDKRQSATSSKKLVSLSTIGDGIIETEVLKGCLEYTLSFCNNMEQLKSERNRLLPIFKSMANNPIIEFTDEEFNLQKFFNSTFSQKRESMQFKSTQELGKETIDIQKDSAYIEDTQRKIERKERNMEKKGKNTQEL